MNEVCSLRVVRGFSRDLVGEERRGLLGVRGRDIEGGSEARESSMPATLKSSLPSNLCSSNTVAR